MVQYNPSLDGLRALAVALVMASHFSWGRLPGGWVGVSLFFVLSGYLITKILVSELDDTGALNLRRFYLKRFLRLTPALALVVTVSLLIAAFTGQLESAIEGSLYAGTYTMNFNRSFAWGEEGALGHTWSLAIEEQFYLLWPLALPLIPKDRRGGVLLAAIIAIVAWRFYLMIGDAELERIYNGLDTRADALLIGCLLALNERAIPYRGWMPYVAIGVLLVCYVPVQVGSTFVWMVALLVAALMSAALIKFAAVDGWARGMLTIRPIVFIGKISYGLYLWHYMLLISFAHLQTHENRLYYVVAVCGASLGLAILSYYFLEQPFMRLKDAIFRDRRPAPVAGSAVTHWPAIDAIDGHGVTPSGRR